VLGVGPAATRFLLLAVAAAFVAFADGSSFAAPMMPRAAERGVGQAVAMRSASPGAVPTLGRKWAPFQAGYGEVKPSKINNGGDPTGLVWRVRWTGWGQQRATARGIGYFLWPGLGVADGTSAARAVVIAYDLGSCRSQLAYRKIEWFFPKCGGVFIPEGFTNICTGGGGRERSPRECGRVAVRSPAGQASHIEALGVTCQRARALVANSPSVRYLHRGGRFRYAGLFCGSEGKRVVGIPAQFECARGRIDMVYDLTGRLSEL
jgi:hypothetical protein